jgi:hypothetical protein
MELKRTLTRTEVKPKATVENNPQVSIANMHNINPNNLDKELIEYGSMLVTIGENHANIVKEVLTYEELTIPKFKAEYFETYKGQINSSTGKPFTEKDIENLYRIDPAYIKLKEGYIDRVSAQVRIKSHYDAALRRLECIKMLINKQDNEWHKAHNNAVKNPMSI